MLDNYRKKDKEIVANWESFKKAGTDVDKMLKFTGYSRATFYRAKKILSDLNKGIVPSSKAPKNTINLVGVSQKNNWCSRLGATIPLTANSKSRLSCVGIMA
jgi:hypothetical protein